MHGVCSAENFALMFCMYRAPGMVDGRSSVMLCCFPAVIGVR